MVKHECHICSRGFKDRATLSSHMKTHTLKPGNCGECGLNFADNASLQKHMNVHRLNNLSGDAEKIENPSDVANDDKSPQSLTDDTQNGDKNYSDIRTNGFDDGSNHDTESLNATKNYCNAAKPEKVVANGESKIGSDIKSTKIGSDIKSTKIGSDIKSIKKTKPEGVFKCTVCEKEFKLKGQMMAHRKLHGGVKVNGSKKKQAQDTVKGDELVQDENKTFSCSVCKTEFSDLSKLQKHHLDKNSTGCYSEETAKNDPDLDKTALFSCDVCDKQFRLKNGLNRHIGQSHQDSAQDRQFKCQVCSKTFTQKANLTRHQRLHVCDKQSKLKTALSRHMGQSNPGDRQFECQVCSKSFTRKSNLNLHLRIHPDTTGNGLFKCQFCDKEYSYKGYLKNHERMHHGNMSKTPLEDEPTHKKMATKGSGVSKVVPVHHQLTIHKCHICSMVFKNKTSYVRHKQWKHSKIFKCKSCKKVFTQQAKLDDHQKTHHHVSKESKIKDVNSKTASLMSSSKKGKDKSDPLSRPVDTRKPLRTINRDDSDKPSLNKAKQSKADKKSDSVASQEDGTVLIRLTMCALCGFTFSSVQSLAQHSVNAHGISLTGIKKKDSPEKITKSRRSSIPEKSVRSEVFSYKCPACQLEVQGSDKLILHIKGHMEEL